MVQRMPENKMCRDHATQRARRLHVRYATGALYFWKGERLQMRHQALPGKIQETIQSEYYAFDRICHS